MSIVTTNSELTDRSWEYFLSWSQIYEFFKIQMHKYKQILHKISEKEYKHVLKIPGKSQVYNIA